MKEKSPTERVRDIIKEKIRFQQLAISDSRRRIALLESDITRRSLYLGELRDQLKSINT